MCVSDFTADAFFVRKMVLVEHIYWERHDKGQTLMFFVWNKILKIWDTFWAHTNRTATQQKTI